MNSLLLLFLAIIIVTLLLNWILKPSAPQLSATGSTRCQAQLSEQQKHLNDLQNELTTLQNNEKKCLSDLNVVSAQIKAIEDQIAIINNTV